MTRTRTTISGPALAALATALIACAAAGPAAAQEPGHEFFTTSDGVRIHYMTLGDQGSWVVLIHGYTDSAERMWFRTGIAPALAGRHRVVALDNRNHGRSDAPTPNGAGRAEDVLELMAHLGIERAHIHGYSMGGAITAQLLASHPERFITAGFGGSGIRENDAELAAAAAAMDPEAPEPTGASAAAFRRLRERAAARPAAGDGTPSRARPALTFGPEARAVPVLAVNGEYDRPYSKTQRILREFTTFQNVVLPGHDHMTAIMVGGPMPRAYVDAMVTFIDGAADTLRLAVGSPEIDGRVFPDHIARNRVYVNEGAPPVNTWTNALTVGDSAGAPVQRWVTRGVRMGPEGAGASWELVQTYDARTLAPLAYYRWSSDGSWMRLRIEGTRVRGAQHVPGEPAPRPIDWTIDRPGFFAGASDLVPMAMRMRPGLVVTAPVWSPGMSATEVRVFSVVGEQPVRVEGADVTAWKVEERVEATGRLAATWYLTGSSPFMVLGEVPLPDGRVQRITGEALDGPAR